MHVAQVIDARNETQARVLEEIAAVIFGGGIAIFPTDTVYGLGCDPQNADAIARIFSAKDRPDDKPLSLHVGSTAEFFEHADGDPNAGVFARRLMPGPVTLIVRKPAFIPAEVTRGRATLGFRVPDDELCRAILERCGPIAATSANRSGQTSYAGDGNWESLPRADLLVENGATRYGKDSSVIDITTAPALLLREGVLTLERLTELLGTGAVQRPAGKM